jgi:hypothetical protein
MAMLTMLLSRSSDISVDTALIRMPSATRVHSTQRGRCACCSGWPLPAPSSGRAPFRALPRTGDPAAVRVMGALGLENIGTVNFRRDLIAAKRGVGDHQPVARGDDLGRFPSPCAGRWWSHFSSSAPRTRRSHLAHPYRPMPPPAAARGSPSS